MDNHSRDRSFVPALGRSRVRSLRDARPDPPSLVAAVHAPAPEHAPGPGANPKRILTRPSQTTDKRALA